MIRKDDDNEALTNDRPKTAWIVTDGKAGDEMQCLGVVEALGIPPEFRRVNPRDRFVWMMPWGPIDPAEAPGREGSPLLPPFPDLAIASGRRAVPYLRAIKKASGGRTFTVCLKDPRTTPRAADFIWVPRHDPMRAENVLVTDTSPHRISADRLAAARARPWPQLQALPQPRVMVALGGDSRRIRYREEDFAAFCRTMTAPFGAEAAASFMVTPSRRTSTAFAEAVAKAIAPWPHVWWDGSGDNPYIQYLALADRIVVSGDSVNMVDEALAVGCPVRVYEPVGVDRRTKRRLAGLADAGMIELWTVAGLGKRLENPAPEPLDSTPIIAAELLRRYAAFKPKTGA
ncbi:MAG: mitochondrial fission ELM1 family protein [Hyphomicrobiales bacterium]|nr:mitochondrial fission ELM1 family protein [Hyphomicrobiales bacterium]